MQLSVRKHYIQFALKYILLKYIISVISSTLLISASVQSVLKCTFYFHKGQLLGMQ